MHPLGALAALFGRSWAFFSRIFDVSQAPCGAFLACSGFLWLALAALTEQPSLLLALAALACFGLLWLLWLLVLSCCCFMLLAAPLLELKFKISSCFSLLLQVCI